MESKSTTDISLVIPAYNRGDLIAETVKTALNQLNPFFEIIVVNDGSTDNTLEVLKSFGKKITVINTKNQGVQAARNTGINNCSTEWIALCDSDDLLENFYTKNIDTSFFRANNFDIGFCNFLTFDEIQTFGDKFSQAPANFLSGARSDGDFIFEIPELYKCSVAFQAFFQSGLLIRKSFFDRIGGYDTSFKGVGAEDWEFTLRAISHGRVAVFLKPLVRVRKHSGNDSADALHMSLGEVKILEYGLAHHNGAQACRDFILLSVAGRRRGAFDSAFARGELKRASDISNSFGDKPQDLNFRIKKIITKLPFFLGMPLWWLTQKVNQQVK